MTIPAVPAAPVDAPKKKLGRGPLIAIIAGAVVLLLVFVGVAIALVQLLLGGGQSPSASAVAFPKSTLYWTELAIEPSNGQKIEAFRFINELDAVKDAIEDSDLDVDLDDPTSNTDLKKAVWEFITDSDDSTIDTGVDYDKDIQPWLGSRISIGLLPTDDLEDGQPPLIIAIEAKNTDAGVDTIEEFIDDLDVDIDTDVQARGGYVVVAVGDVDLDDVYDDGTLDQAENFTAATTGAGDWGVASLYVDLGALYSLVNQATSGDYGDVDYWEQQIIDNYYSYVDDSAYEDYEDCSAYDSPENVGDESYEDYECNYYYEYAGEYYEYYDDFAQAWVEDNARDLAEEKVDEFEDYADQQKKLVEKLEGTTAFVVARFVDGSFEVSGQVAGVNDLVSVKSGGGQEAALPASTIALLSISGIAESLDAGLTDENLAAYSNGLGSYSQYYGLNASTVTRDDVENWFDDSLGIDFPDDLSDLFGTKTEIVIDADLDTDELESGDLSGFGDFVGSGAALVITSDDADATVDAWEDLIDNAEDNLGDKLGLDIEQSGNRVVISAGDYLDTVLEPDERLGELEAFRRALPAADKATSVMYLDVKELLNVLDDLGGDGAFDFADGVQALGITTTQTSDDSYAFVLRVTTEAE